MFDVKTSWKAVTDRKAWSERRATLVARLKATQAVWFPSSAGGSSTKAVGTAKKASKTATKKASGTAKKGASAKKS